MKARGPSPKSVRAGKSRAQAALARREVALRTRAKALAGPRAKKGAASSRALEAPTFAAPRFVAAAGARASKGVLVAEGDSWFDYPGTDVLSALEDEHGFDVASVAHKGDRVEDMAYSDGQLDDFIRTIERLLRWGQPVPRAILLSGGGNDIAGDEMAMLLDHASSPSPGWNESVVAGVIDQRLSESYAAILAAVTEVCRQKLGTTVPIVLHGYDYPVPDGRGFLGGWGPLPGPWLDPSLRRKGYPRDPMAPRLALMRALIDRFNAMVARTASRPEFAHVRYVNLRGTLSSAPKTYKDDWGNELHPTRSGFRAVAKRIAAAI